MMIYAVALCIIFIVCDTTATQSCTIGPTPVVNTNKGKVQGCISVTKNNMEYLSYKGIPYAKPPIGRNRFKPPVEVEPWSGVLNANTEGSSCPQSHSYGSYDGDEDCLYLNVYTSKRSKKRPVMVWIHGGVFKEGSGDSSVCNPNGFIDRNVIFVTINYRLGALGFLAMRHPNAMGNAGLKDQSLALKWVQQNIANFGGDPEKVTIFGKSSGSISANLHLLSPMSHGLFRSSILISGTLLNLSAMQCLRLAEQRAFKLGSLLGCETRDGAMTELLECLYNIEPRDLVMASSLVTTIDPRPFSPTVEDSSLAPADQIFLSECPIKTYKSGKFSKLPVIIGHTKDETLIYSSTPKKWINKIMKIIDFIIRVLNYFGELISLDNYVTHSLNEISNNGTRTNVLLGFNKSLREILDSLVRIPLNALMDIYWIGGIDATQKILGEHSYYYVFTFASLYALHRTNENLQLNVIAHIDDNEYLFDIDEKYFWYTPQYITGLEHDSSSRSSFGRKLKQLWTNFAIYNDPTPNGVNDTLLKVKWSPAGTARRQLNLDRNLVMKDRQHRLIARIVSMVTPLFGETLSGCDTDYCTVLHLP